MRMIYTVNEYLGEDGYSPYSNWLASLRDAKAMARVISGVDRMETGNLGDSTGR